MKISDVTLVLHYRQEQPTEYGILVFAVAGCDVGPVMRQVLTRADDFFGVLFSLTLYDKLIRGQVPE
jgi:hypothetical protein